MLVEILGEPLGETLRRHDDDDGDDRGDSEDGEDGGDGEKTVMMVMMVLVGMSTRMGRGPG